MLCPCSRVVFSITEIYVARVIDAFTEMSDAFLGLFFGELKSKRFMVWVFGRDSIATAHHATTKAPCTCYYLSPPRSRLLSTHETFLLPFPHVYSQGPGNRS